MENRNNALHYKMYKSGKSIVYAGLATTAALAGLVLANTNATAVHADATPAATEQVANNSSAAKPAANSTATSAQISAASDKVVATSGALSSANVAVSAAQSNYSAAMNLNSGVAAVASASAAYKEASDAQSSADKTLKTDSNAAKHAGIAYKKASAAYSDFQRDYAGLNLPKTANEAQTRLTSDEAELTSYTNQLSDVSATSDALQGQLSAQAAKILAAQTAQSNAQAANDNAALEAAKEQLQILRAGYASLEQSIKENGQQWNKVNGKKSDAQIRVNADKTNVQLLNKLNETSAAKQAADDAYTATRLNYKALQKAADDAFEAWNNVSRSYNLPNGTVLKELQGSVNTQSDNYAKAKAAVEGNTAYPQYKADSDAVSDAQKNLADAQSNASAANKAAEDAQSTLDSANAALAAAKTDAEKAEAKAKVAEATTALQLANVKKASAASNVKAAQAAVKAAQDKLNNDLKNDPNGKYLLGAIENEKNAETAFNSAKDLLNQAYKNLDNAKDAQAAVDAASAALENAKAAQKAAQEAYDQAVAEYKDLTGTTPTPDQPNKPDDNTGDETKPSEDGDKTNTDATKPSEDGDKTNTDATNKDNVASDFTGEKNGNYYVNGKQVTKAAYDAHVAAQSLATVKTSASVKGASAAATANDSKALPQTGNENASAVVALGAVSAMFGLGLAAKKREF